MSLPLTDDLAYTLQDTRSLRTLTSEDSEAIKRSRTDMTSDYDAIVIGAGHNALVSSICLTISTVNSTVSSGYESNL